MELWKLMALVCTCWFLMLEVIELVQSGPADYFTNVWNVLDWTNFAMFAQVYMCLGTMVRQLAANDTNESCTSKLCLEFGYLDRWEVMETAASAKLWMSLCVCIQVRRRDDHRHLHLHHARLHHHLLHHLHLHHVCSCSRSSSSPT